MQKVKVLIHCDTSEEVGDVINGALILLPPFEPIELDEFIGNAVLQHKGDIHGIVEVEQVKSKSGVEYRVDEALEYAAKKLEACEQQAINFYVRQQMEDRIAAGRPALPPNGRVLQIILKRKVSLRDEYGIVPVGWKDPGQDRPNTGIAEKASADATAAQGVVKVQQETIAQMQSAMADQAAAFQKQMQDVLAQVAKLTSAMNGEQQ